MIAAVIGGIERLGLPRIGEYPGEVVESFQEDHLARPGLFDNVAMKARERIDAVSRRFMQNPVAGDPLIDHGEARPLERVEPASEVIWPVRVGAERRADPVGDRVAEGDDRPELPLRRQHIHTVEELPSVSPRPAPDGAAIVDVVPGRDVADLLRIGVLGNRAGRGGQVDADRKRLQRRDREAYRSLSACPPAGASTEVRPANLSASSAPGARFARPPLAAIAASPIHTARRPKALVNRTRTCVPPAVANTSSRSV